MALQILVDEDKCIGCGNCVVNCPVYNVMGNEFGYHSYLGGRGVAMSKYLKDNETSVDSGLYMCTLCGMCTENCPVLTPTYEIIEDLRNAKDKEKSKSKVKVAQGKMTEEEFVNKHGGRE